MEAKWTVYGKRADFNGIAQQFNIDPVVARIIRNRDIIGDDAIDFYLNGKISDTYSPETMKDLNKGCQIIIDKIKASKKIRIISDYDVDGVMSNYILLKGLQGAGADVSYEIPDRIIDGYGINERIIMDAEEDGIDTIITCDNGIAAFSAIELAKQKGMTVVVTDHHEVPYEFNEAGDKEYKIVPADAVIDIKQADCSYPFKGLCGAGVAYKFIRNLYTMMNIAWDDEDRYIDTLAIATVCDVMELVDENRIFVKKGMEIIEKTKIIGLRALLKVNNLINKPIKGYHLGFIIGPCINATGRLESAKKGLELFLCDDEEKANELAENLLELNTERKKMTEEGTKQALEIVKERYVDDTILVIYLEHVHESLAGIIAGRVRETFYKPVFVFTGKLDGMVKGSGRSIEGYHMFDALNECSELLTKFGGHELAAGLSLEGRNLDSLRKQLNENQKLTEEQLTPIVRLDVPMPVSYISERLIKELDLLEPFGKGNEKPIFGQANMKIKKASLFGKESQYIRITFMSEDGYTIEAVDFNANKFIDCIKMWFTETECDKMLKGLPNEIKLDVAYYPDVNEFGGRKTIQIKPIMYKKS